MPKQLTPDPNFSKDAHSYPNLEFHLRQALESTFDLNLPMFALANGKFQIDYHELQNLILTLGEKQPERDYKSSELHGMGLLTLLSHKVIRLYRNQVNQDYIQDLTTFLDKKYGSAGFKEILYNYLEALPTDSLKSSPGGIAEYLSGKTDAVSNQHIVVEELLVHVLALNNPAFEKYNVIFKESFHPEITAAQKLLQSIQKWSDQGSGFGSEKKNIIELLLEPVLASPDSIEGQLEYIKSKWSNFLGSHLNDLLRGLDHFEEENRFRGGGPGETQVPSYSGGLLDGEYYSEDSDWMPRVVMIARNTLVWLDQLSKKYGQTIKTLSDIPDQELDLMVQQGFTVLWLIGLWNRSNISKTIKHWCGNPDAESSAYSLKEYQIDPSIGGPEALENLRHRAWERGIRLASDMVPNHTGLDSQWLKDHPEWYVSAPESPFPSYRFNGGDLSHDPEVSIHLEDHYYDRSDAAVVFKLHDHRNNSTNYVYHGNDGTSMPWNDTAQLNYLNPELREAIIQTILDVARQFKVIRFDAAMTLAKKHIQRLWFPEPGSGGDIPSRSNYNMSGVDFDAAIPAEFWREVVERVAKEVPDTLLLAEAFWMMEGYFVRTLGMHRVYNSAFMNMLKMEENAKFFEMMTKTLEFDPRILQRFVNFLSNPDEDTAIAQFGKGDKYFGATILMVTLPGLPMFAHAQIEGFEEKYGMEYRRAYWDETPDEELVARHKSQIFPLMKRRYLFAGASNFRLFPFHNSDGHRVDSVFAYTNRNGTERALILVHNSFSSQSGWIKTAVPVNTDPAGDQPTMEVEDLVYALSFDVDDSFFIIFQEQISGMWFIRSVDEIRQHGFYAELSGYESQIYLNFQLVSDTESNPWSSIYDEVGGSGVSDFAPMFRRIELEPVHQLFGKLIKFIADGEVLPDKQDLFIKFAPLLEAMLEIENISLMFEEIQEFSENFDAALRNSAQALKSPGDSDDYIENIMTAAIIILARQISAATPDANETMIQKFGLEAHITALYSREPDAEMPALISVLEYGDQARALLERDAQAFFRNLFNRKMIGEYFLVNEDNNVLWFNRERMEVFLHYFEYAFAEQLRPEVLSGINLAFVSSECKVENFLNLIKS